MFGEVGVRRSLAGVLWAAVGSTAVVYAQASPARAKHPVFGEAQPGETMSQSADLTVSTEEAFETNVLAGSNKADPTIFRASGAYSVFKADGGYNRNGSHVRFTTAAGTNIRYYPDRTEVVPVNHYAFAGVTASFLHRTTLSVNQTVAYVPSFLSGLFPTVTAPVPGLVNATFLEPLRTAGGDYSLNTLRTFAYGTSAALSQRLTPHSTVRFDSDFQATNFVGGTELKGLKSYDMGGHWLYRFNRNGTIGLGYTYKEGQYLAEPRSKEQGLDLGVQLGRALSRSRRATVSFSIGSAIVDGPAQSELDSRLVLRHQQRLIGTGGLSVDLGSTWRAQGSYRRGVLFVDGFSTPLFIDGYAAEIGGFVNRRADVRASAAYSTGEATVAINSSGLMTYTGDIRLRYAIGRMWATYAEYSYYYYSLNQSLLFSSLLPSRLERNGIHVGLTLWTGVRSK